MLGRAGTYDRDWPLGRAPSRSPWHAPLSLRRKMTIAGSRATPGQPRIVLAGAPDFDEARQCFNLAVDQRPQEVAYPSDAQEVAALVRRAGEQGLRIAVQRAGHGAQPLDWERPALLLRTDALQGVTIDAAARTARVNAGVKWDDIVDDLSELGLAALHGSARDIGIAGYSLGGGLGWLARKHGLQANSVTAIELVTADGELVRADRENEPELFWALRGGGGNFGVVTALEFDLYPVAELYAGAFFYDFERGGEVLHAWRELTSDAPDELTSVFKLLQLPDLPEIPEPLRGKSFAVVTAAFLGEEAEGAALVEPLRQLGPMLDTFAMVPPVALSVPRPGPRGPAAVHELPPPFGRAPRRGGRQADRDRGRRFGIPTRDDRAAPPRRSACTLRTAPRRVLDDERRVRPVRAGRHPGPRGRAGHGGGGRPSGGRDGALEERLVPQLRRAAVRHGTRLRRGDVAAAAGREGAGRPGRGLPGQPSDHVCPERRAGGQARGSATIRTSTPGSRRIRRSGSHSDIRASAPRGRGCPMKT